MQSNDGILLEVILACQVELLEQWIRAVGGSEASPKIREEAQDLLTAMIQALESPDAENIDGNAWQPVKKSLEALSASRVAQGVSAGRTSAFVLGLKIPLFVALQARIGTDNQALISGVTRVTNTLDRMAQWTVDAYQRTREDVIVRQQHELLELSTPVIKLWDGVLAVPMIGTLDSNRTQLVMETLLQRIVDTESTLAIIDITGVPTVDTLVAQHLLKTAAAIRLMGADCIISGIRPQIAQTIVHLGIDLQSVTSKATLADALALAMKRNGYTFTKAK